MPSFIEELEADIAAQNGRPHRRSRSENAQPREGLRLRAPAGERPAGGALSRAAGPRKGRALSLRAGALSGIDYSVPEPVPALAQPKTMACWATALTILFTWRDRASRTIEDVTSEVGAHYRTLYDTNAGLTAADKDALVRDAGLASQAGVNLSPEGWTDLLRKHGPVWVTTRETAGIHGRIVHGIHGDGTPKGTTLDIIDPAGGRTYGETVEAFLPKFEAEAIAGKTDRINLVYLAQGRSAAQSLSRKARGRRRGGAPARGFGAVSYTVPGTIALVPQPTDMTCWAASYTMMENWSRNRSTSIETAVANVGAEWADHVRNNKGLSGAEVGRFITAAGMVAEPAASYPVEEWAAMLRDYGPLLIVTDEAPGKPWAVHARVIWGISGDGTAAGTTLKIFDPWPPKKGRAFDETVAAFLPKYEEMAEAEGFLGLQILHFPPDAQLSVTRSLRAGEAARAGRAFGTAPSAVTIAERFGGNMPQRVEEMLKGGVSEAAVVEFLMALAPGGGTAAAASARTRMRMPVQAMQAAPGTTITLPTGHVLEGWKAELLITAVLSAMSTALPAAPLLLRSLQSVANTANVTIGLGVAGSVAGAAGDGAGLGLGAGLMFAPGNRIGYYGSLEHTYEGLALGASAVLQFTVVKGGPSNFSGRAVTIGGAVGEGLVGGARGLLTAPPAPPTLIGFVLEAGVGAGLSPVEITSTIQETVSSLGLPGMARMLGAARPGVAAAARHGAPAAETARRLLAEGVPEEEIVAFLATFEPDAPTAKGLGFALATGAGARVEVHLPGATVFTGWRADLFLAMIAGIAAAPTAGTGAVALHGLIRGLRELANRLEVTIAVGPAIAGGLAAGGSFGAGLVFAPGDRIGFYGTGAVLNGALASISATMQVTVVHGGPDLLDGGAVAVGAAGSAPIPVSPTGGFYVLMAGGGVIGVTAEVGIDVGLAPLEVLASFQYSGQTIDAPGAQAQSRAGVLARGLALPDLSAWQHLIRFTPPADVSKTLYDKMNAITPEFTLWDGWPVQPLWRASGPINLDYYPVRVTRMPQRNGRAMTAGELLEAMRLRLNHLVDNRYANFAPYDDDEARLWASGNPEGAVLHIDMRMGGEWANPDDGSVACTRKRPDHWIFSTIWTVADAAHPVSGHRQFGVIPSADGVIVYTRGADRPTRLLDAAVQDTIFSGAHSLWMSLQQGLKAWIEGAGGSADIMTPISQRHDWDAVRRRYG